VESPYSFEQLYVFYSSLLCDAGLRVSDEDIQQSRYSLLAVLKNSRLDHLSLLDWLISVCEQLRIEHLLSEAGNRTGELEDLLELKRVLKDERAQETLESISYNSKRGKLVLTTIHSAKGREFEFSVVAGVENGLIPWNNAPKKDEHFRRLLYVACTRAKYETHLVYSSLRPSIFIPEIQEAVRNFRAAKES
jgi:superfamily I DNA/RNA helicase